MKYIIDGYNLVHKISSLRNKRPRSQREGLIRFLEIAQTQDKKFKDLTVVFDGQKDIVAPRINSTVKIIFSKGKNADKKIKEILEVSSFARDIAVVTDDREVKSYTSSLRAKNISLQRFLQMLSISQKKCESFKLRASEERKINQELEAIWLERKGK